VALSYPTGDKAPCPKPPAPLAKPCSGLPASSKPFCPLGTLPGPGTFPSAAAAGPRVMLTPPLPQKMEILGFPALKCDEESAEPP